VVRRSKADLNLVKKEIWEKLKMQEFVERLRREGVAEYRLKNFYAGDFNRCSEVVGIVANFVGIVPTHSRSVGWKELSVYESDCVSVLKNGYRPPRFGLESVFAKLRFGVRYERLELEHSGRYILGFDFRDETVRELFMGVDNLIRLMVLHFVYRYIRDRFLISLRMKALDFLRSLVYWRLWLENIDWVELGNLIQNSELVQDYIRRVFELRLEGSARDIVADALFDGVSGYRGELGKISSWVLKVCSLLQGVLSTRLGRVVFEPDRLSAGVVNKVFNLIDSFLYLWGLPALLYHRKSKSVVLDMSNSLFLKIDGHFMPNYVLVSERDILHAVAHNRVEKFLEEFAELVLKSERILDEIRRLVNG
jgi:hypothetical protein